MESLFPKIDREMAQMDMNYRGLAKVAGVNNLQMYRRLRGLTLFKLSQTKSNVTKRDNLDCLDIKKGAEAGFTPAPTP